MISKKIQVCSACYSVNYNINNFVIVYKYGKKIIILIIILLLLLNIKRLIK